MTGTSERATGPRLGAVRPLEPGDPRQVGRYVLSGRLGAGGMGTVYLARAGGDGPLVAVKVVHPELDRDPAFRARFADEVAAARRVAPFCTARVLDADPSAHPPYLVTEFVDGVPLGTAVSESGPLDPSTLHGVALGVAAALASVHAAGVVHRDLKPANVLLSLSGPRVIDFGIARALDAAHQHTVTGMMVGTPGWMAPEQFRGGGVRPASDVFSWGSLIAYAATGRNPWEAAGSPDGAVAPGPDLSPPPAEMAFRIVHGDPDLTGLTGPLRRLVEAALAKDPARRPTARQLVDELLGGQVGADATVAATRFVERTWTGRPAAAGG
ncbi:MAG TPA: serine/threonine-protein kinase, partial [Mycobacteriales bacterium]|nr:serine/threonine-protein kinase [Mycobacteriales bacterium]